MTDYNDTDFAERLEDLARLSTAWLEEEAEPETVIEPESDDIAGA
jgi:hypothetical protein